MVGPRAGGEQPYPEPVNPPGAPPEELPIDAPAEAPPETPYNDGGRTIASALRNPFASTGGDLVA